MPTTFILRPSSASQLWTSLRPVTGLASFGTSSDELWAPPQGDPCGQVRFLWNNHTHICPALYLCGPARAVFPFH